MNARARRSCANSNNNYSACYVTFRKRTPSNSVERTLGGVHQRSTTGKDLYTSESGQVQPVRTTHTRVDVTAQKS